MVIDAHTFTFFRDGNSTVGLILPTDAAPDCVTTRCMVLERREDGSLHLLKNLSMPDTWDGSAKVQVSLTTKEAETVLHTVLDAVGEVLDARSSS